MNQKKIGVPHQKIHGTKKGGIWVKRENPLISNVCVHSLNICEVKKFFLEKVVFKGKKTTLKMSFL
jgi:hypothetical protein